MPVAPRWLSQIVNMVALAAVLSVVAASAEGPCDILAAAGNKCVAAHSTVRALYAHYAGPLYRVQRTVNNATANVSVLKPGGFADIVAHERFCAAGDCVIKNIFDQSPQGNHLGQRISDGVVHKMVNASKHKISVAGGVEVFGMWFDPGHGYHVDFTSGIAKGNDPESIYAVMSGTHFNGDVSGAGRATAGTCVPAKRSLTGAQPPRAVLFRLRQLGKHGSPARLHWRLRLRRHGPPPARPQPNRRPTAAQPPPQPCNRRPTAAQPPPNRPR